MKFEEAQCKKGATAGHRPLRRRFRFTAVPAATHPQYNLRRAQAGPPRVTYIFPLHCLYFCPIHFIFFILLFIFLFSIIFIILFVSEKRFSVWMKRCFFLLFSSLPAGHFIFLRSKLSIRSLYFVGTVAVGIVLPVSQSLWSFPQVSIITSKYTFDQNYGTIGSIIQYKRFLSFNLCPTRNYFFIPACFTFLCTHPPHRCKAEPF